MGLCDKGDKHGQIMYAMGEADEFYPTWHLKLQPEKERLVALIKARMPEACLSHL